jgi:hypothetical protein
VIFPFPVADILQSSVVCFITVSVNT